MSDLFSWAEKPAAQPPRQAGNIPISWMYHPLFDPIGQAIFEDSERKHSTRLPEARKLTWESLTDMTKSYYRWQAKHQLAILLGLDTFKPKDFSPYLAAAKVALDRLEFLSREPGWEDYFGAAARQRLAQIIEKPKPPTQEKLSL